MQKKDKWGKSFQFILNGIPVFAKGADVIPHDCFITRFNKEKLKNFISAVKFSNMNMLRIWGGGYYASDEFLSECDKNGILIWQDFQFACQAYPFLKKSFLKNVLKEVDYSVKRMESHPSVALLCGNNEIEQMHTSWITLKEYVRWTEKFFYNILPEKLKALDSDISYIPGSPCGSGYNKGINSDNYFEMLPNEQKYIIFKPEEHISISEIENLFTVSSLCDVEKDNNRLKIILNRLKIFTSPINIGNMIFHGKIPSDEK